MRLGGEDAYRVRLVNAPLGVVQTEAGRGRPSAGCGSTDVHGSSASCLRVATSFLPDPPGGRIRGGTIDHDLTHALAGRDGSDHAASGGLGSAADREAGAGRLGTSHGATWRRLMPSGVARRHSTRPEAREPAWRHHRRGRALRVSAGQGSHP
ncbi:hypothetical protein [Streptomyces sp. NPDC002133]|uniref:hypothetical protein n=1 Tax=Streptomyces sp. NPDC002133 TaxID=3154409 RepID=UPI00331FC8E2